MITTFRKGINNISVEDYEKLREAIEKGDTFAIKCYGSPSLVSSGIFAIPSEDLEIWNKYKPVPLELYSAQHLDELAFIRELSVKRDENIADQPLSYPIGMREVSVFLENYTQISYASGVDYMNTRAEFENVYNDGPIASPQLNPTARNIVTLRDASVFVHSDNPMELWINLVANRLVAEGCPVNRDLFCANYIEGVHDNFVMGIYIGSLYWEVARRISALSFRTKWHYMFPRPEQVAYDRNEVLISQAFPEGSPRHPSHSSMHGALYTALYYLTIKIFDPTYIMGNGKTVEYNSRVFRQNGTHFRLFAGVHYMNDNESVIPMCEALVDKIITEKKRKVASHGTKLI